MGLQKPKTHRDINNPHIVGSTHLVRLEVEPDFCNANFPRFQHINALPQGEPRKTDMEPGGTRRCHKDIDKHYGI